MCRYGRRQPPERCPWRTWQDRQHAALADGRRVTRSRPGGRVRGAAGRDRGHHDRHRWRAGPPPRGLRPRRADEVRAGRGGAHRGRAARAHARRPRRDQDRQHPVPKWETVMAADPVEADALASQARNAPLTRPRPGHADLAGMQKYGHDDARAVLERASARETAARVALGELGRRLLRQVLGAEILSHVVALGTVRTPDAELPGPRDLARIDADPVRCLNQAASAAMQAEVDAAHRDGDTLGGVVEVLAYGVPPGLGSYVHADRRLDGRLAGALMSIHAIKGVEIGDGFVTASRRGSAAHDEIENSAAGLHRLTNRAGGIEGGMSTGEPIRLRVAMKPISTVPRALATVDVATGEPARAINQRSDVTAVPAAGVVAEAMTALILADATLEKF